MGKGSDTASGALSGAAVGSAFGPVGAGVGGAIGGAIGYLGSGESDEEKRKRAMRDPSLQHGNRLRQQMQGGLAGVQGRQAPQMQGAQLGPGSSFRGGQEEAAGYYRDVVMGNRQGAAEVASQRAANRSIANQQAMARMGRGAQGATMARQAAGNVQEIGVQRAGDMRQAALSDQAAAAQQYGQILGQARQADQARTFQQAGLDQATSLANMDSRLKMMGMNDEASLAYLAQLYGVDAAEMQARLERDKAVAGVGIQQQPSWGSQLMQASGPLAAAAASGKFGGGNAGGTT